jgi:glycosyltransferase involved in cell wall biosynthesis
MSELLVISSYPREGTLHGNEYSAVAGYAKNTLDAMDVAGPQPRECVVLADVLDGRREFTEGRRRIVRCWKRNDWLVYPRLLRQVLRFRRHKNALVEFEFGMFGNRKALVGLFPLFVLCLRLLGRRVTVVSHGVITNAAEVSGQLGLRPDSLKVKAYGLILKAIYGLLVRCSSRTVVFEEYLRQKLLASVRAADKVRVIPHGVERRTTLPKPDARRRLGLDESPFLLLSFGFLTWYKGTDWLAETFARYVEKHPGRDVRLILAGDASHVHKDEPVYRRYIHDLRDLVGRTDRMEITGYLAEEEIDLYFSAADLVVLPYRALISASGPFSFALTHGKPFLLSGKLRGYLESNDFQRAVRAAELAENDLYFDLDYDSFRRKLDACILTDARLGRVGRVASALARSRSWKNIGRRYADVLAERAELAGGVVRGAEAGDANRRR